LSGTIFLMSRTLFVTLLLLAALAALLIGAMNAQSVAVELAFARLQAPLGLALVTAFALGILAGLLGRAWWVAQLLSERGRLRRALRAAETEVRAAKAEVDAARRVGA